MGVTMNDRQLQALRNVYDALFEGWKKHYVGALTPLSFAEYLLVFGSFDQVSKYRNSIDIQEHMMIKEELVKARLQNDVGRRII